jgi:thioredoxin 1
VDDIANETAGKLKVVKLDTDNAPSIAAKYNIMSIPTLILFKKGDMVEQLVGMMPKQKIMEKVTPHL